MADQTNGSYGDAARHARLGDVLAASPQLAAAVDDGSLSPAVAEAVAPTVTDPQLVADAVVELLPTLRGLNPREAKRQAERWAAARRSIDDDDAQRRGAQAYS